MEVLNTSNTKRRRKKEKRRPARKRVFFLKGKKQRNDLHSDRKRYTRVAKADITPCELSLEAFSI